LSIICLMDRNAGPPVSRLKASQRRQQIVETAFETIADEGFEGLRTRDVAKRAGINSATLHHYFPTKEDLIEGVAAHLESLYRTERAPSRPPPDGEPTALRELRQEFADVAFVRRERPRTWAVSREFTLRAPRDDFIANVITRLNERWRDQVEHILLAGREAGVFRRDLDSAAAASAVVGALWGSISLLRISDTEFDAVCREIEVWLVGKEGLIT
jgi:AcrR family transcriptional regulator